MELKGHLRALPFYMRQTIMLVMSSCFHLHYLFFDFHVKSLPGITIFKHSRILFAKGNVCLYAIILVVILSKHMFTLFTFL